MKKIISMILAIILMFTLVSCTPPASTPSSAPLNMADVSTPALDGKPYTISYGIEFEANNDWLVIETGPATYVLFYNSLTCCLVFAEPMDSGVQLSQEYAESFVLGFCETFGSNATAGDISHIIVDDKDVWTVNVSSTVEGQQAEVALWLYGDDTVIYTWFFMGTPEEYETYFPYAQALVKSMKLPVS